MTRSMELTKALFSPTSVIRNNNMFRTKRSLAVVYSFVLAFCVVLLISNSHIHHHSTYWIKHLLRNRERELGNLKISPPHATQQGNVNHYVTDQNEIIHSDRMKGNANETEGFANKNETIHSQRMKGNANATEGFSDQNETIHSSITKRNANGTAGYSKKKGKRKKIDKSLAKLKDKRWVETMSKCDMYDGRWVKDDSPPLYAPGSCPHIDEPFNCYENGRPDNEYERFRWQPNHCNIPRSDGQKLLKFFRGKRIVYVGDSLNRNMWESMVCLLRNAVKDKSRVFEASGREDFKKEGSYSFLFPDYNCSVEYIRSAFLVQESEVPISNGNKKETLKIDQIEDVSNTYKDADVLVFNTGHWWTHERTSEGKEYYQEGDHVHKKLDVVDAFQKAMTTWADWVQNHVDTRKTNVFFRGYSLAHFSEGDWNSGGKCDGTTEPVKEDKDLMHLDQISPPIPQMLEKSISAVTSHVHYLNVTSMTNFRRDAHPSIYRKANMTKEEKESFLKHQDCSHWCLPGVPDTWNQLLYAKLLLRHKQRKLQSE